LWGPRGLEMSKRVYEVARELGLSTNEVMRRLNDAGVGVKSHLAVVEDPVYERVFGDASGGHGLGDVTPNGRPEAQEAEALQRRIQPPRKRSPVFRFLVYVLIAVLAFVLSAGVGAMSALMLRVDIGLLDTEEPRPPDEQENAPRSQGKEAAAQQEDDASQQSEDEYVARVGDIQADSVETFLDSHDKLLRYDALTAEDVEEMQANKDSLKEFTERVDGLDPPQKYRQQYETFNPTINELYEAAQRAYSLVADPTAATQSGFDEYDRHVNEAAAGLERSNEILGRDYKTIEGVQKVNPLS
jgi:hypothetical protein